MKNPWLKFYPADWRADPALRVCSIGARGLWMEMLCLMHEAEPYGSLLVNRAPVTNKQLASLCGISPREALALLSELAAAGVFSSEDGTVYSRRMRRDQEKAERDKANGKGGGNPTLKGGVNPKANGEDKAQNLEARVQKPEKSSAPQADAAPKPASRIRKAKPQKPEHPDFPAFYDAFPRHQARDDGAVAYDLVIARGAMPTDLLEGAKRYAAHVATNSEDKKFVKLPATWLRKGCWRDEYEAGPTPAAVMSLDQLREMKAKAERMRLDTTKIDRAIAERTGAAA